MDVVIDGMTCIQQRNDPIYGAQDLQTWSWSWQSIGAITASVVGSFMTQYWEPRFSFIVYAMVAFVGMLTAIKMHPKMEDIDHQMDSMV